MELEDKNKAQWRFLKPTGYTPCEPCLFSKAVLRTLVGPPSKTKTPTNVGAFCLVEQALRKSNHVFKTVFYIGLTVLYLGYTVKRLSKLVGVFTQEDRHAALSIQHKF